MKIFLTRPKTIFPDLSCLASKLSAYVAKIYSTAFFLFFLLFVQNIFHLVADHPTCATKVDLLTLLKQKQKSEMLVLHPTSFLWEILNL